MTDVPGLSFASFEKISPLYWVGGWKNSNEMAAWFGWRFGAESPPPVPNQQMYWRHPTYEEAARRQEMAECNMGNFTRCVDKYGR